MLDLQVYRDFFDYSYLLGTLCSCVSIYIYGVTFIPVGINCKVLFTTIIIKYFGVAVIAAATIIIIFLHNVLLVDGSDIPIAGI